MNRRAFFQTFLGGVVAGVNTARTDTGYVWSKLKIGYPTKPTKTYYFENPPVTYVRDANGTWRQL
jgi:hypothetical protein